MLIAIRIFCNHLLTIMSRKSKLGCILQYILMTFIPQNSLLSDTLNDFVQYFSFKLYMDPSLLSDPVSAPGSLVSVLEFSESVLAS